MHRTCSWDHPRLCGEKRRSMFQPPSPLGSPPPMRGKGSGVKYSASAARITPAYAGKSFDHSVSFSSVWDHPRLCGEKLTGKMLEASLIGSPPPMRGKVVFRAFPCRHFRITPAYAGKSSRYGLFCAENKDHPRLCGEKHNARTNRTGHVGSPPPMRGKVYPLR